MSSILTSDIGALFSQWGERVAFNEGYQKQKISDAHNAGRDAFSIGLDRGQARDQYFASKDQRFSEAREFLLGDSTAHISGVDISDVGSESITELTDGEETLGMESVVASDTVDDDDDFINGDPWGLNTGDSGIGADQIEWSSLSSNEERSDFYSSRGLAAEGC